MTIRYIQRRDGVIVGSYANSQPGYAEEQMDDASAEYLAWIASLVIQPTISLDILQARIEVENLWDTYVNYMFGTANRRNAFLKTMFIGKSLSPNNTAFKNSLLSAGATQEQVDRITAV